MQKLIFSCLPELDEELISPTSRKQRWKSVSVRSECREALRYEFFFLGYLSADDVYRRARAEMETASDADAAEESTNSDGPQEDIPENTAGDIVENTEDAKVENTEDDIVENTEDDIVENTEDAIVENRLSIPAQEVPSPPLEYSWIMEQPM